MSSPLLIGFTKFLGAASTRAGKGAGGTWPGEVALRLSPSILSEFTKQQIAIIFVAGTNGKTTTAKMIDTILSFDKKKVRRNETGANLDNGIVSAFLKDAGLTGKLRSHYFIFEVDEATLPILLKQITPTVLILLNLFRDQLDRYGEVDAIAEKWKSSLLALPPTTRVIINGDDPHLAFLGVQLGESRTQGHHGQKQTKSHIYYIGLNTPELFLPLMQHATDSIYCPKCGNRLTFGGVYFSHLGRYACGQCGFTHPTLALTAKDVESPLEGVYNLYNVLAATMTGIILDVPKEKIQESLRLFRPAFGRMEQRVYEGKKVKILLSKNPTGFNESLRTYLDTKEHGPLLILLNDRIPDGTDVSWIWDVDFELLTKSDKKITISGDRCCDMALRLKYAGVTANNMFVREDLEDAVADAVSVTQEKETLWILATYSAMLDVRKILTGKKIL